jgi:leader peptidase (prepilin peptidase)/N-methyltransferase
VLLLILISFIDLNFRTIPDVLSIGGLSIGLVLAFFRKPFFYYQDALYGIFLCGGILFAIAFCCQIFFKKEILGLGDIVLLSMIGAFCGLKGAVFSFLAGSLLGTLVGIPIMLKKGTDTKYAIPFGPFLSLGALFYMSFGDKFVYAFLRLLSGSAI